MQQADPWLYGMAPAAGPGAGPGAAAEEEPPPPPPPQVRCAAVHCAGSVHPVLCSPSPSWCGPATQPTTLCPAPLQVVVDAAPSQLAAVDTLTTAVSLQWAPVEARLVSTLPVSLQFQVNYELVMQQVRAAAGGGGMPGSRRAGKACSRGPRRRCCTTCGRRWNCCSEGARLPWAPAAPSPWRRGVLRAGASCPWPHASGLC